MFIPLNMRSANAYKSVGVESAVLGADAHQMIGLLYEAVLKALGVAKMAIQNGDIPGKGQAIGRAVRLIDEGLKAVLNDAQGGEIAANLRSLYDYCVLRLCEANLRSDLAMVEEVEGLVRPVADAWSQIRAEVTPRAASSLRGGV